LGQRGEPIINWYLQYVKEHLVSRRIFKQN
jgi:hypothetical protein